MKLHNRRYTGSKYKLIPWLKEKIIENCHSCHSFFDVFGGTGVVTAAFINDFDKFIINDFLFSNEIIYKAFFMNGKYAPAKLAEFAAKYNETNRDGLLDNYVSDNYGDKYFSRRDAKLIGYIRNDIKTNKKYLSEKEYCVLLASLLYSMDRCANTVGHYDAFIKGKDIKGVFAFELVEPFDTNKEIAICRRDANELSREISADVAFIDPPYNSRQYSRFYHVLETMVKWDKPSLGGVAMKPPEENMSDYCKSKAPAVFADLIKNLNAKYIAVTYNNTYNSKSSSSKNKITLEEIDDILSRKGKTKIFQKEHQFFNAGKTEFNNHREYLFITETEKHHER